jgi:hypothetical protein
MTKKQIRVTSRRAAGSDTNSLTHALQFFCLFPDSRILRRRGAVFYLSSELNFNYMSPCRSQSTTLNASSFLICLASPVVRKMLCGNFSESRGEKLKFDDVDRRIFIKALEILVREARLRGCLEVGAVWGTDARERCGPVSNEGCNIGAGGGPHS